MDCPNCNVEMSESYARIKWTPPWGKKPNTLKEKSKPKRVFKCPKCGKTFCILMHLGEVTVVGPVF